MDNFDKDLAIDPRVEKEARCQVSFLMDSLNPSFPRSDGKHFVDNSGKKNAVPCMPRHWLDLHAQCRNKGLESPDDLSLPDFIQGFCKLIMSYDIQDRTVKITHLSHIGKDVALYPLRLALDKGMVK